LPPEAFAAAQGHGQARTLEMTVQDFRSGAELVFVIPSERSLCPKGTRNLGAKEIPRFARNDRLRGE
jgi:hypothetical protein